jgi:hypothetical protein
LGGDASELFIIRVRPTCTLKKSPMKSLLTGITAAVLLLTAGCCTHPKPVARGYRVVHGVTDAGGVADLQEKLNSAGREGFTIHSTTLLPKEEGQRLQAIVILERPVR